MRYIFLSYASEDYEFAKRIAETAEALGFDVWLDKKRLEPSYKWESAIEAAIQKSTGAVFLLTEHSLAKDSYIQEELALLVNEAEKRDEHCAFLLPVRIGDKSMIHPKLSEFQHLDIGLNDPAAVPEVLKALVNSFHRLMESAERHQDQIASTIKSSEHPADRAIRVRLEESGKGRKPKWPASDFLFSPDEFDIYVNKNTFDAYIFHGRHINLEGIKHLLYDPDDHTMFVYMKDGTILDLGAKIQWLVRPYLLKAYVIGIVRTENREEQEGIFVPLFFMSDDPVLSQQRDAAHGLRGKMRLAAKQLSGSRSDRPSALGTDSISQMIQKLRRLLRI